MPGALFEETTQSSNDAWRKLHSDPLLMIRQREQEALARIKNNPIKMAMIRKSVSSFSCCVCIVHLLGQSFEIFFNSTRVVRVYRIKSAPCHLGMQEQLKEVALVVG